MCSTPFGITDYFGPLDGDGLSAAAICAQRLSASRIISVAADKVEFTVDRCAQRLSASRIISAFAL